MFPVVTEYRDPIPSASQGATKIQHQYSSLNPEVSSDKKIVANIGNIHLTLTAFGLEKKINV
jgi:hypothetical protein